MTNAAGLNRRLVTPPLLYDPYPPNIATGKLSVCNTDGVSIAYQTWTNMLRICVEGLLPTRSGLMRHDVTLAWTNRSEAVTEERALAPTPRHTINGIALPCGVVVTVRLAGVSGALVQSASLAASVYVVCSPPTNGIVTLDASRDVDGVWYVSYIAACCPLPPECALTARLS